MGEPAGPPSVADLFDRVADDYDAVGVDFFKPIAQRLVDELAPRPSERALDIGCGRGAVLLSLANAVGPGGVAIGLDASPRMVELTKADVAASVVDAEVLVGDAQRPEFEPESFDIVAASLVIFFLPDPLEALRAWRELLVDGGRVGITTFGPYSESWAAVDAVLNRFMGQPVVDARTTGTQGPFSSAAATADLGRAAGLRDVTSVSFDLPVRFDDGEQWYRWSNSVGQRRLWDAVPAVEHATVKAEAIAALDRTRDDHGRIGFDQQVRITLGWR